ncbi:hypothetical protein BSKO_06537 [Bryopsis sp. KO-2023]|nr:hypothetical protein BSKO_06537 [Bryopsis sp. KO-2023]
MDRSRRSCAGGVDYTEGREEASDAEGLRVDFRWLYQMVLGYGGYSGAECKDVSPESLTREWFESTGFREPVVVRSCPDGAQRMGMKLPEGEPLTVSRVVQGVGLDCEVPTIDVAQQSEGPNYTLAQWEAYWNRRCRDDVDLEDSSSDEDDAIPATPPLRRAHHDARTRLLNVVSLSLAGSPLEEQIEPPTAVSECEMVREVWPKNISYRPEVLKFALMSPAGSYTDFHLDYGGSSVWYHVVSGKKVFAVVPPTNENLQIFTAWAASAKQQSVFLGEYMKGMIRVELGPGDTVLLPGGWPHAVATSRDSVVIGGNFLHRFNLRLQLEVWRVEDYLRVKPKFRFPHFRHLMWYTLDHIQHILNRVGDFEGGKRHALELSIENKGSCSCPIEAIAECRKRGHRAVTVEGLKVKVKSGIERGRSGAGMSNSKLKRIFPVLTRWEVEGIPILLFRLSHWLVSLSKDHVPADLPSPKVMLEEVCQAMQRAGYELSLPPPLIDLDGTVPGVMAKFKASNLCIRGHDGDSGNDSDWAGDEDCDFNCSGKGTKRKRRKKGKMKSNVTRSRAKRVEVCQ